MTKTIYYSGIYKNVGKKPTMAEKKRMKEKAEKIQKEIVRLLDFYSLKKYKGEPLKDREELKIVVLRTKLKHFRFLQGFTKWNAIGTWKGFKDEKNYVITVQFADTPSEYVGQRLIELFKQYNKLVVGEQLLFVETTPVEETTL